MNRTVNDSEKYLVITDIYSDVVLTADEILKFDKEKTDQSLKANVIGTTDTLEKAINLNLKRADGMGNIYKAVSWKAVELKE